MIKIKIEGPGKETATVDLYPAPETLGYDAKGRPIFPIKPGMITTAAVISCIECRTLIRGMGGPRNGAKCVPCFEKEHSDASDHPIGT